METVTPSRIAGIRFQELGKLYHFEAAGIPDLKVGDQVLVSTSRGRELGEVAGFVEKPPAPPEGAWKAVERRATAQEMVERRLWQRRELEAMIECRAKASELGMRHVKIAKAEFSYDGSRLTFLFSGEGEEKVDVRDLRREMGSDVPPAATEFRHMVPPTIAKCSDAMGACGLEE